MAQSGGPDPLLTDLCSICHVNPIKYTCPRCSIHTCSLPCVKRHKLWAQCSGVRDPAAFKKRQDLATPSAIDQDYNFITKVERSLQRADDNAVDKGLDLAPAGIFRPRPNSAKSKFEAEAEKIAVVMVKAPQGLSRSKQNTSHWNNRLQCLLWTIEWRLQNEKRVFANSQGGKAILEAYQNSVGRKGLSKKRPREEQEDNDQGNHIRGQDLQQERVSYPAATGVEELHFYLHRSNTPSKYKCLIPLDPSQTINEALAGRTILEFPTIYAIPQTPEDLLEPFITESEFMSKHGTHISVDVPSAGPAELEDGEITALPDTIDDKKVLEVLQKDIGD